MSTRPTLRDVARQSGVSEISVSRVMRDAPNISSKLRARVEAAARELGYTPNRLAGGLKSQTSGLVAVVVPSMSNNVFPEVVDGIDRILSLSSRRTVLGLTHYDADREERIIRDLLSWSPSGIILAGLEHSDGSRRMLENADIPVIEIMDIDGTPIDTAIGISQHAAARTMADHLLDRGYRRIGYIGAWGEAPSRSLKRRLSFEERLIERNTPLVASLIAPEASSISVGRAACAQILAMHPGLDALFFTNDDLAVGGLLHCMVSGIEVPGQLALAGFNGIDFIDAMPQQLTTIQTPRSEMGEVAAQTLLDRGAHQGKQSIIDLGFILRARDTT